MSDLQELAERVEDELDQYEVDILVTEDYVEIEVSQEGYVGHTLAFDVENPEPQIKANQTLRDASQAILDVLKEECGRGSACDHSWIPYQYNIDTMKLVKLYCPDCRGTGE